MEFLSFIGKAVAGRSKHLSRAAFLCACLVPALAAPRARAGETPVPEYRVKAAFLYHFAKFVEWPTNVFASSNATFNIGVVGKDPFGPEIEAMMRDKSIDGRGITITRFATVEDVKGCQMLFIPQSENGLPQSSRTKLAGQSVLTVGDGLDFARRGGIIGLVKSRDEIHFEINTAAAAESRLKLSSKLLRLAKIVTPEPERKRE